MIAWLTTNSYLTYSTLEMQHAAALSHAMDGLPGPLPQIPMPPGVFDSENQKYITYNTPVSGEAGATVRCAVNLRPVWFNGLMYGPGHPLFFHAVLAAAVEARTFTPDQEDLSHVQLPFMNGNMGSLAGGPEQATGGVGSYSVDENSAHHQAFPTGADTLVAPANLQPAAPTINNPDPVDRLQNSSPMDFVRFIDQEASRQLFSGRGRSTTNQATASDGAAANTSARLAIDPAMVDRFHAQADRLAVDMPAFIEANAGRPPPYADGIYDSTPQYNPEAVPAGGANSLIRPDSPYPFPTDEMPNEYNEYMGVNYSDPAWYNYDGVNGMSPAVAAE